MDNLETFFRSYLETALWADTPEDFRAMAGVADPELAPATLDAMRADCAAFLAMPGVDDAICEGGQELPAHRSAPYASAGHDFWLTRNRHGAGFWDGDWTEPHATTLDKASKAAGERSLYIGDDGLIYQS